MDHLLFTNNEEALSSDNSIKRSQRSIQTSAVDFFFRLIDHRLNRSLKNQFFSIFGIFDHV